MSISWDTFERYRQKGLDARRAGQWESARIYLLEAARAMLELSKQAIGEELKEARRQTSAKLLDLARDCQQAQADHRKSPAESRSSRSTEKSSDGEATKDTSGWLMTEKPGIRFDDVAGLDDVKEEIRLKMLYPLKHPELAQRFAIRAGGGVLLYGPPGTGKTMLAKATAGEIEAAFFRVSPADILSKWVGEAEQNIKKLFDAARAQPLSIVFIDEIEALVPARKDEGSSVMQRVVPQILQEMEGIDKGKKGASPILFMGATNVPWQLDPAVLRPGRFDEKIYIPLPDLPARRKMLDIYLGKRPVADDVNLDELARRIEGFSGADIKYITDRAATIPFLRAVATGAEQEISQAIVDEALADAPKTVTREMLARFDAWRAESASGN